VPQHRHNPKTDYFLGAGLGLAHRTRFPAILVLSEYGLQTHYVRGFNHAAPSAGSLEMEGYATLLGGAIRLGYRNTVVGRRSPGHIPMGLTIGLTDVGSLLYWITR
jgi:hypothetical protein